MNHVRLRAGTGHWAGGPPLKVKLTSVAESCLESIARGTPGRVRSFRTDSWAGSGLRAPFCLWNQSAGPLARVPPAGGVPNTPGPKPSPTWLWPAGPSPEGAENALIRLRSTPTPGKAEMRL